MLTETQIKVGTEVRVTLRNVRYQTKGIVSKNPKVISIPGNDLSIRLGNHHSDISLESFTVLYTWQRNSTSL